MKTNGYRTRACLWVLVAMLLSVVAPAARADVVTDANARAADVVSRIPAPPPVTVRAMAIVQVSVFEAVNAITGRYLRFAQRSSRRRALRSRPRSRRRRGRRS